MKTILRIQLLLFISLLGSNYLMAQPKITLSHLGTPSFYTNLNTAITAATNGDTIYLPGGAISPTTQINVSKSLHFVGAGHYPDSTLATGVTWINDMRFTTGASGGSVEGIDFDILTIAYSSNQIINGFTVKRCAIDNFYIGNDAVSTIEGIIVTDNLFRTSVTIKSGYPNILVSRNVFAYMGSAAASCTGLLLKNNIIYAYYANGLSDMSGCTLENNIIISVSSSAVSNLNVGSFNCQYINNLFIPNVTSWNTNTNTNNLLGQTLATTFVNVTGLTFSYANNYHLLGTSPGVNYGTDGTDVGIYGTSTPFKDGAVPFNPHIMSKSISSNLTPAGILNVNVTVSAQDY